MTTEKTSGDAHRKSNASNTKKNSTAKATKAKVGAKSKAAGSKKSSKKSFKKSSKKSGAAKDTKKASAHKTESNLGDDLFENSDQMSALLTRGFDLLEAGIGLGIKLVDRLGNVAQEQVVDKVSDLVRSAGMTGAGPQEDSPKGTTDEPTGEHAYEESATQQTGMHIVNRLPLSPNSKADISFSINNNSPSSPKTLSFTIEGFVGETHNVTLDSKTFSIRPSKKLIAPMDFEKFMLKGDIPKETPEDSYHGWIIVSDAQERFKIPVTLFVSS